MGQLFDCMATRPFVLIALLGFALTRTAGATRYGVFIGINVYSVSGASTIGQASAGLDANPIAAHLAVKDAVSQAINDIMAVVKK